MTVPPLVFIVAQEAVAVTFAEELIRQGYRTWLATSITGALTDLTTIQPSVVLIEDHFVEGFRDVLEIHAFLRHEQQNPVPIVLISSRYAPEGKVSKLDIIAFDIMQRYNGLEYIYRTMPTSRVALWYPSRPYADGIRPTPPSILILSTATQGRRVISAYQARGYTAWLATSRDEVERLIVRSRPALVFLDDAARDDQSAMDSYLYVRHSLNDPIPVILLSTEITAEDVRGLDLIRFEMHQWEQAIAYADHVLRGL